jgi:hypothetical protein
MPYLVFKFFSGGLGKIDMISSPEGIIISLFPIIMVSGDGNVLFFQMVNYTVEQVPIGDPL